MQDLKKACDVLNDPNEINIKFNLKLQLSFELCVGKLQLFGGYPFSKNLSKYLQSNLIVHYPVAF